MDIKNIHEAIVNGISQFMGAEYMTAEDGTIKPLNTAMIVDVGQKAEAADAGLDNVFKAMVTQLGILDIQNEIYRTEFPSMFIKSFEWGGYLERVYFDPLETFDDPMYNLVAGRDYSKEEHTYYQPKIKAKLFTEAKPIVTPISRTFDQIKDAFTGLAQLESFMSAVSVEVENTNALLLDAMAHALASAGVAISDKGTGTARHLVTEMIAKGILSSGATDDDVRHNETALAYCYSEIAKVRKYMTRRTKAFNNGAIPAFGNTIHAAILYDFIKDAETYLKRVSFNKEESDFGEYDTITMWQGVTDSTDTFTFDQLSTISIAADPNEKLGIGTEAYTKSKCIGLLYDWRALGICPYKEKVTSNYTASADFVTAYHHRLTNWIIDPNFSMVAFFLD
jgi:hypothetical protein